MHLESSLKLKALFLLPVLLLLFSFSEGFKGGNVLPVSDLSGEAKELSASVESTTFYIDGEVVDPTVEVPCKDVELAPPWTCSDATGTKYSFPNADFNKCAPRPITWDVGFQFPSEDLTGTVYQIVFIWKFNETTDISIENAYWDPVFSMYRASSSFVYPSGIANNTLCSYTLVARLRINGTTCLNADAVIPESLILWDDISNSNIGIHDINQVPPPTSAGVENGETVEVCRNDDSEVFLMDASTFNCTNPFETVPSNQNDEARWVQWVYGTANNVATGGIGAPNSEKIGINGVFYDDSEFPVYGEPEYLSANVVAPNSQTLAIRMPSVGTTAGQIFTVTLRSWNTCNPYDDNTGDGGLNPDQIPMTYDIYDPSSGPGAGPTRVDGISGSYYASDTPIERTYNVEIVANPVDPVPSNHTVCNGDVLPDFEISATGNVSVNWYEDNAGVAGASIVNSNGPNSLLLPASDYPGGIVNTVAGVYTVWVEYSANNGSQDCTSDKVQVDLVIREDLAVNPIIYDTGLDPVCAGTNGLVFYQSLPAATELIGGATEYIWSVTGGLTINGSNNSTSITVDVPAGTGDGVETVTVYRRYSDNSPSCNSPIETYDLMIDAISIGGTLSGGNTPICEGSSTGIINLNAGTYHGSIVQWERQKDGAGYLPIPATAGLTSISQTLTLSGTYDYRVKVQNGSVCSAAYSTTRTIVVNDRPSLVNISGSSLICQGDNATLNISITDGTAPYNVTIDNGVGSFLWSSSADDPVVSPASTTTYSITGLTDFNGCTPTSITGSATITIGNPTDAVISGDAAICNLDNTDLSVAITGGTGPYVITINDDQISSPNLGVINNYTSGDPINTGALTSTTIYTLASVIDSNGCNVLGMSDPTATITVGVAVSNAALNVADVCDGDNFVFSVTITDGAPPYQINYSIDGGGSVNIPGYTNGSNISLAPQVIGVHTVDVVLVTDNCGTTFGPIPQGNIEVFALPTANNQTPTTCSDASGGTAATVDLTTLETAIDGGAGNTITWYENNSPLSSIIATPASYVVTNGISVYAQVDDGMCTDVATVTYTVNPRPAAPTNPVNNTSCNTGGGVALSVDDPLAGATVRWFTTYTDPSTNTPVVPADGTISGNNGEVFTPTASTTATFYAAIEIDATGCLSPTAVAVVQTEDQQPATANAETSTAPGGGGPAVVGTCDDTFTFDADPATNGGTGTWSASIGGITYTPDANTANATAHNIPVNTTVTFTWTVTSALGVCATTADSYDVTHHPLPVAINYAPEFCEDAPGSNNYDVTAADLTTMTSNIIGGAAPADREVKFFINTTDRTNEVDEVGSLAHPLPYQVHDADIFYVLVRSLDVNPNCINYSEVTFTINTLPAVTEPLLADRTFCEDVQDPFIHFHAGVDLTAYNATINNTATITWFPTMADAIAGTNQIALATAQNFTAFDGNSVFAKAVDANSCANYQSVDFVVNPLPADNVITGNNTLCTSNSPIIYSVNPLLNTFGTTHVYNWSVDGAGTNFEVYDGTNFITLNTYSVTQSSSILLLTFQNPGTFTVEVSETIDGCLGNPVQKIVTVSGAPAPLSFSAAPTQVCKGESGVVYSLTGGGQPNSVYYWSVDGGIIQGPASGLALGSIIVDWGTSTSPQPNVSVYEVNDTGCSGAPVSINVFLNDVPVMTSGNSATICSGEAPSSYINFTGTVGGAAPVNPLTFNWQVTNNSANISVANLTGSGNLSEILTNTSALTGFVEYTVTPQENELPSPPDCDGVAQIVTITVEPEPVASIANATPLICNGDNVNLAITKTTTSIAAQTFDVAVASSDTPNTGGAAFAALVGQSYPVTINGDLTNSSNSVITVTYSVTPKLAGCADGTPVITTVDIEPTTDASVNNTTPLVCNGDNVNIDITSLTTSTGLQTFDVTVASTDVPNTGGTAFASLAGQTYPYTINGTLINNSSSVIQVTYTITPKLAGGCSDGTPIITTVDIEPEPTAVVNNSTPLICNGDNANIAISSSITTTGAQTFDVAVASSDTPNTGGTAFATLAGQTYPLTINGNLTNSSTSVITVTYTVTPKLAGCADGTTIVTTVDIEPTTAASVNNTTPLICNGDNVGITITTPTTTSGAQTFDVAVASSDTPNTGGTAFAALAGQTYPLTINGNLTNSSTSVITVTYAVTPKLAGCADGIPIITTVDIEPTTAASVNNTTPLVCNGDNVGITVTTPTTTSGAQTFDVAVLSNDPINTGGTAFTALSGQTYPLTINGSLTNSSSAVITVTYTITPKLAVGCSNGTPIVTTVDIEPTTAASVSNTTPLICDGDNVNISISSPTTTSGAQTVDVVVTSNNAPSTGGSAFVSLFDQPYDVNITGNLTNSSASVITVTYAITPKLAVSCANGTTIYTTVDVEPTPVVSPVLNSNAVICSVVGNVDINVNAGSVPSTPTDMRYNISIATSTGNLADINGEEFYNGLNGQSFPGSVITNLTNNTAADIDVTFTFTPTLVGCANGTPQDVVVKVEPTPALTPTLNTPSVICDNQSVNITVADDVTSSDGARTYGVTVSSSTGNLADITGEEAVNGTTGNSYATPVNILNLKNNTLNDIDVTFTFTPELAGGCANGPSKDVIVTLEPTPSLTPNLLTPTAICDGEAVNITIANNATSSVPGALTYGVTVTSSTGNLADITGEEGIDGLTGQSYSLGITTNLSNNTNASIDVTFSFTPELAGCTSGTSQNVVITIDPKPNMITANAETICSGDSPTIDLMADISASYQWTATGVTNVTGVALNDNGNKTTFLALILENYSGSVGTVTFNVVPTGTTALSCVGPTQVVTITVDPAPVMTSAAAITICSGNTPGITFSSNVTSSTYVWKVTAVGPNIGGTYLNKTSVGNAVDFSGEVLTNLSSGSEVVTYEVTPTSPTGCPGVPQSVDVTVDPSPSGVNDTRTICSNDNTFSYDIQTENINSGGNGVIAQFTYTVTEITATNITLEADRTTASSLPLPQGHTYVNTNNAAALVRYVITPVGFGSCSSGPTFNLDITINPEPVINPLTPPDACSNIGYTITPTSVNYSALELDYHWTITSIVGSITGNGSGLAVNDTDLTKPFPHTVENVSSSPAVITYAYTATGKFNSCESQIEYILVTVNPEPVGIPTTLGSVCSDETITINPDAYMSNISGNTFTWTANYGALTGGAGAGAGNISEVLTNITNATIDAVYTVTPTSSGGSCPGNPFNITVPVMPEPVFDPTLSPADVCSGVISGITLGTAVGSVAADGYNINGIILDPGIVAGGDNAIVGTNQLASVLFNDIYTNTTSTAKNVTYKVQPVTAGCLGKQVNLIFKINPAPAVDPNLDKTVCSGDVSGILLSGGPVPILDYNVDSVGVELGLDTLSWAGPSNNVINTWIQNDQFENPTNDPLTVTYKVIPNSSAVPSCAGPAEYIVLTIEPKIIAAPTNNNPSICSGETTDIQLVSPSNPTAGSVSFNIFTSVVSGTASGFIPSLSSIAENYVITDNLVNTGNTDATVRYEITPVAPAAASNNGCTGTAVMVDVVVHPQPVITPGQYQQICSGNTLNYDILSSNGFDGVSGTKFFWSVVVSDPGLTGASERLEANASTTGLDNTLVNTTLFRQTATYTVTPISPDNCKGNPTNISVFVDPTPDGTISVDNDVVCYNGSALLSFAISPGSAPFEIVYNDGTSDITVSNIANSHFIAVNSLTATKTYTFKSITDANGCTQTLSGQQVTITVEHPVADFTMDIDADCTPLDVTFTNNNVQAGTVYDWNFGDGSPVITTSDVTVTHTYVNNSTTSNIGFTPILTATNTNGSVVCTNVMADNVTIYAGVSLNVNPSITEGCSPLTVNFDNTSSGVLISKWFWRVQGTTDENEIQTSTLATYTLNNTTTSNIVYEVVYQGERNGCSDQVVTEITVYPEVSADFTVDPGTTISITDPTITVTNTSPNASSWITQWEWGDGQTTTNVDPGSHTYATFGQYEVKLTIRDPNGVCESTKSEIITVEPTVPQVDFTVDITEGCMPLTVQFTNLSTSVDPDTYQWTLVDDRGRTIATSTLENPEITFFEPGIINVTLSGSNPLGVTDTETKLGLIEVFEIPTASFSVRPETVFLPDQVMFTNNLSKQADVFEWDFNGDGIPESDEFEPSFKYTEPGVYDVSLIATNSATGCSDTIVVEKAVTVVESGTSDIPNGFFPGSGDGSSTSPAPGDPNGSNSVFLPRLKGVREDGFNMQIFDRWGHLLFESDDKTVGWNGRHFNTGKLMPAGVYVYKLELVYVSGQQTTVVGDVNLIR